MRRQKQPLPIYRKIRQGAALDLFGFDDDDVEVPLSVSPDVFAEAIPFDIQAAATVYWTGTKDFYRFDEIGPLRLPFPTVWTEWVIPHEARIEGRVLGPEHTLPGMRCGAMITEAQQIHAAGAEPDGPSFDYTVFVDAGDGIRVWPAIGRVELNEDGTYHQHAYLVPTQIVMDSGEGEQVEGAAGMLSLPVLIALGLINCRNVETRTAGQLVIPQKRTDRRHRVGSSTMRVDYHTIVLPGGAGQATTNGHGGGGVALHQVRGHFKRFTAERPLLGKHIGTYWWGWQVRGSKEHGEIVADYALKGSRDDGGTTTIYPDPS